MTNKDLIAQYVDTGVGIPEYQINKLSNNDKKTYIRKRWINFENNGGRLTDSEIELLSDEQRYIYYKNKIIKGYVINDYGYDLIDDSLKIMYQKQILNKPDRYMGMSLKQYYELPNIDKKYELKKILLSYFDMLIDAGWGLKPREVEFKNVLDNEK